jgi:mono/diheme cytochrome c family protein
MANMLPMRALSVVAMLVALHSGAHAQTKPSIARGHDIAKQSCNICHSLNGQEPAKTENSKAPSFKAIAGNREVTRNSLKIYIMIPKHPMPIVRLRSAEIDDGVACILSLK